MNKFHVLLPLIYVIREEMGRTLLKKIKKIKIYPFRYRELEEVVESFP